MQQFLQNFAAYVDGGGQIYAQTFQGNQLVGYTTQKYAELEKLAGDATEKAEAYKKQLVDAGLIQVPLTPEEQIAALTKQVAELAAQNAAMNRQVSGLADLLTAPTIPSVKPSASSSLSAS